MEKFKEENWAKDKIHIEYYSLKVNEINEKIKEISKIYNLDFVEINNSNFFLNITKKFKNSANISEINESKSFPSIISLLDDKISMETIVYLIWNYDSADKIKLSYLSEYWDYIWYGVSDEMVLLYFAEYQKILLITDHGVVYW